MKKLLSFPLHQQQHLMKLNQLLMSFSAMALAFCVLIPTTFSWFSFSFFLVKRENQVENFFVVSLLRFSAHIFSNMIGIKLKWNPHPGMITGRVRSVGSNSNLREKSTHERVSRKHCHMLLMCNENCCHFSPSLSLLYTRSLELNFARRKMSIAQCLKAMYQQVINNSNTFSFHLFSCYIEKVVQINVCLLFILFNFPCLFWLLYI